MKKGFTLMEMLAVLAILGAVTVLIGSNFIKLINSKAEYENENLFKLLNEAACIYIDSEHLEKKAKDTSATSASGVNYSTLRNNWMSGSAVSVSVKDLIGEGFVDTNVGLLNDYTENDLKGYKINIKKHNSEKKCCVDKSYEDADGNSHTLSGKGVCD